MAIVLHTDHLRKELEADTITCDVLRHDIKRRHRLVTIVSVKGGERSVQTIAYTYLQPHKWTQQVAALDAILKGGSLMGETFRKYGFGIRQNRLISIRVPLCSRYFAQTLRCKVWNRCEVEVYEFWADGILYGLVVEVKHPSRNPVPRKNIGYHKALKHMGITSSSFIDHLDSKDSALPSWKILLARLAGILVSFRLYIKALNYTQYWLHQLSMSMKQRQ